MLGKPENDLEIFGYIRWNGHLYGSSGGRTPFHSTFCGCSRDGGWDHSSKDLPPELVQACKMWGKHEFSGLSLYEFVSQVLG